MLENTLCVHANVKTSRRQCANGWKRCDFDNHRNVSLLFGGAVRAGHDPPFFFFLVPLCGTSLVRALFGPGREELRTNGIHQAMDLQSYVC